MGAELLKKTHEHMELERQDLRALLFSLIYFLVEVFSWHVLDWWVLFFKFRLQLSGCPVIRYLFLLHQVYSIIGLVQGGDLGVTVHSWLVNFTLVCTV